MDPQSPHNLPGQPNALLGRDRELQAARDQLLSVEARLLSLTGPPGVGKTRLGMAVAESCLDAFSGGVWLVDLAPLQDPALVGSEIAGTFGVAELRAETALDSLAAFLRGRQVLLFLDNFEGVLPAAAWIGKLLERTPGLKILTTSRERLRLRWERTILVPPLRLADLGQPPDLSTLAGIPSIALFVQRATAVNADFTLSHENAPIITYLCTRLDGLPLAIELAAARAGVLSPAEILAHMDDRFHLLGMGALDLPERHQTLKAAIDWSYESLSPARRQFLRRLSVFSGGFSLAAAELVAESKALGLDGLESAIALVEKGLLNRVRGPAGETRFTLLESIRDYLLDRLRERGKLDDARRRHAAYFLELAERYPSEMKNGNQKAWFDLLETEMDNLRAALQWSLDAGEPVLGRRIAAALWYFWWLHGHIQEGARWLETFLGNTGMPRDEIYLRALEGAGTLRGWQGDFEPGRAYLMEALEIAQEREDEAAIIRVLGWLGWILWVNGKTEQAGWLAERMAACGPEGDPWDLAYAFLSLGSLLYEAGLDDAAGGAFTRSLEYFRFAGERHGAIFAGSKLALLKQKIGELQEAQKGMLEALEAAGQSVDLHIIAYCAEDAAQLIVEQNTVGERDWEKIARVWGAVDHWREILGLRRTPHEDAAYLRITESLRRRLGEGSFARAWKEGQSVPAEEVVHTAVELLETPHRPERKESRLPEMEKSSPALSERERQVIGWVAEGLSNQEIAGRLFITERTVRFHLTSIFNKLGADNRAQAVAIANRLGLL